MWPKVIISKAGEEEKKAFGNLMVMAHSPVPLDASTGILWDLKPLSSLCSISFCSLLDYFNYFSLHKFVLNGEKPATLM